MTSIKMIKCEYEDLYNDEVLNYSKILSHKIKSKKDLFYIFDVDDIDVNIFLDELMPFEEDKLDNLKIKILDTGDQLYDIILISNELSSLIIDEHVEVTTVKPSGRILYKMDDYAVNRLNEKFGLDLSGNYFSLDNLTDDDGETKMSMN